MAPVNSLALMEDSPKLLFNQRLELGFKAVLLRCLDEQMKPITYGSGFIRREAGRLYLYTCWHVVTGYDKNDLKVKEPPTRAFLSIEMQDANQPQPGVEVVGGIQSVVLPLYDTTTSPKMPTWLQDSRHIPHTDLNAINIFVPFWHDAVRIPLPDSVRVSELQVLDENDVFPGNTLLTPGDKLYIVGYPYGYSAHGAKQPTPVVLTRFVAATKIKGRQREVLLESTGAPAMSGGPVFVERESSIHLLGLYTGLLYPDHVLEGNEKHTALGTCTDLCLHLYGHLSFVEIPAES